MLAIISACEVDAVRCPDVQCSMAEHDLFPLRAASQGLSKIKPLVLRITYGFGSQAEMELRPLLCYLHVPFLHTPALAILASLRRAASGRMGRDTFVMAICDKT